VFALVLTSALLGAAPSAAPGRVVEAVIATVQASPILPVRPITLTRLREEARVALVSRGATEAAFGRLDGPALAAALEWLIDQTLVAEEADRLFVAEVGRDEVAGELRRFRNRFASPEEYARFLSANDLGEEELLATLARSLRVQRFVEGRVGQSVKVSEAEIDDYLRGRGVGTEPSAARDAVRALLGERKLGAEVKKIVAELRARATVRILLAPAEAASD
jgi:predicted GNAT family acetyltransferase